MALSSVVWVTWQLLSLLGLSWLMSSLVLVTVFKKISFKKKKKKEKKKNKSDGHGWRAGVIVIARIIQLGGYYV